MWTVIDCSIVGPLNLSMVLLDIAEQRAVNRGLQAYDYPNNVQELFSMIENAWCHYTDGGTLTADMVWTAQSPEKLATRRG